MNVKEIKELVDLVSRRGLAGLEIERAGFRLRIEGAPRVPAAGPRGWEPAVFAEPVSLPAPAAAAPAAGSPAVARVSPGPPGSGESEGFHVLTSPIVGTFYRAANPDAEPFVKVGDVVEKGKTLCIVEAMKLMNEIEADVAGTIVAIYPQNAQPVEFGEKLFAIQPR
ncbi:MAG TPA: acetyl-CoA carboxylase biotin carboxyl carrier protein [Thermoanaerobaculia bacterium]|jgi:acetyl-CoA carboxylase biotin carboxyl carrier protein